MLKKLDSNKIEVESIEVMELRSVAKVGIKTEKRIFYFNFSSTKLLKPLSVGIMIFYNEKDGGGIKYSIDTKKNIGIVSTLVIFVKELKRDLARFLLELALYNLIEVKSKIKAIEIRNVLDESIAEVVCNYAQPIIRERKKAYEKNGYIIGEGVVYEISGVALKKLKRRFVYRPKILKHVLKAFNLL